MPKKKPQSVDSAKRQPKAPAKKRPATPTADTKATTAKSESLTYSRVTNSVIDRIRGMVSDSANTLTTSIKSTKKKRVVPAKTTKKPAEDSSVHVTTPPPATVDIHVSDVVLQTEGKATNSVIDRIRSMVSESANAPTIPANARRKKRVVRAKATKKQSTALPHTPTPSTPANVRVTAKRADFSISPTPPATQTNASAPDSYELPFDVDAYLREKEATLKPQLNRVREQLLSPSSRGWILVNMGGVRFTRTKLKRGMHLYWQVPEGIGQMMRGDHIFLWQTDIYGGIIGHGYLADLPIRLGNVKQPQIVHNINKPGTNSYVVGVRVVSAHQRLAKAVMKSMPIINTIHPPSARLPHKQPLTTEQTFALLELWYL